MSQAEERVRVQLLQQLQDNLESLEREGYLDEALKLRSLVSEFAIKYVGVTRKTYFLIARTDVPCVDNGPHEVGICDNTGSPFCFRCNHWVWYLLGKRYANFSGKREVKNLGQV